MTYRISVIMPVYNAARFLKEAIDSLIGQTIGFENLQVIMVDDCSTDESPRMMDKYAEKYSNIEVYKTEVNSGAAGKPRNIGLRYVKAPYVMFLDADDLFEKKACEILYHRIKDSGVDVVSGYFCLMDIAGKRRWPVIPCQSEIRLCCPEQILDALRIFGHFTNHIYKYSFIQRNNIVFTKMGYGEDTAFICKCFAKHCEYIYMPELIVYYRQNDCSVTHTVSEHFFGKCVESTKEIRTAFSAYPEALHYKLESWAASLFSMSVSAHNLDYDALVRVYRNYKELFVKPQGYMTPEYTFALKLISSGDVETAAEYALAVREFEARYERYEEIIRQHENRLVSRIADAFGQRRFGDAVRICFEAVKSRLHK